MSTLRATAFARVPVVIALLLSTSAGQSPAATLSVEWMYSPARFAISRLPEHAWRADGKAFIEGPEGVAVFDPATRTAAPAFDLAAAARALGTEPGELGWPAAFDPTGRRALYELEKGPVVLDLASARARPVPVEGGEVKAPRFSPDGGRLSFVVKNDLHVMELETGTVRRLTFDGSDTLLNGTTSWVYWEEIFGREDLATWWSPDGGALAFLQFDERLVDEAVFVDFRGAPPAVHRQRYPKAGTINPSVRVGVVEVEAKGARPKVVWMKIDPAGAEYVVRVRWLPDGKRVAVQTLNRAQNRLDLWVAERGTGAARHVMTESDPAWVSVHDDLHFLKDGERFVWASERDGWNHLYLMGMDGKPVRQLTKGPWAARGTSGVFWGRKAIQAVDEEGGWVYFTGLKDGSVQMNLYRVRLDGSTLERLTPEGGTHQVAVRPDGRCYFDAHSDHATPPALTFRESGAAERIFLSPPRSDLVRPLDLAMPELFTIPARDGFEMPAYVYKPKDFDPARRYPLVLYVYGGPSAPSVADAWDEDIYFANLLLRQGFLVACFDNRSATAISKELERTVLGQMYGDGEVADLEDGVRWLKKQSWVDPERVGIWGWSGGGTFTLLAMTRTQEFKAGIAVAAVTRWEYYDTFWGESVLKRPQDNPAGYLHTDLTRRAKDLHGRLLLVHGTYDDNVHPQNCWHFAHELINAGKLFEMMIYPMRQHGISDRAARIHLFNTMLEFWRRNL